MLKRFASCLLVVIVMTACQSTPKPEKKEQSADEQQVKKLLSDYAEAFNSHDTKRMSSFWTEDGDLISAWGELATSREDVEKVLSKNNNGKLKNAQLNESIEFIRFITPDVALADVDRIYTGMVDENGKQKQPYLNHAVYALVKRDGKWQIVAVRSYIVTEPIKSVE